MKMPRKLLITVGFMFGFAARAMASDLPKERTKELTPSPEFT
jgi:hypothetical protein